jgi:hypothetical protein
MHKWAKRANSFELRHKQAPQARGNPSAFICALALQNRRVDCNVASSLACNGEAGKQDAPATSRWHSGVS